MPTKDALKTEIRRNLAKGYHLKGAISMSEGDPAREQYAWDLLQARSKLGGVGPTELSEDGKCRETLTVSLPRIEIDNLPGVTATADGDFIAIRVPAKRFLSECRGVEAMVGESWEAQIANEVGSWACVRGGMRDFVAQQQDGDEYFDVARARVVVLAAMGWEGDTPAIRGAETRDELIRAWALSIGGEHAQSKCLAAMVMLALDENYQALAVARDAYVAKFGGSEH